MDLGPISLALAAGGLATVNPCGFAMLPAFLSFYVGADEDQLPRAFSRTLQGVVTGLLVASGVLVVFGVVALPITYGATQVVRAIPWAGIALGVLLIAFGIATTLGKAMYLRFANPIRPDRQKQPKAMFVFGVGYGVASLGCTLPVFLAVFGASLATQSTASSLLVLGAYGLGMAITLVFLSIGAALLRDGLARALKKLTPYMPRITGTVLVIAGISGVPKFGISVWPSSDEDDEGGGDDPNRTEKISDHFKVGPLHIDRLLGTFSQQPPPNNVDSEEKHPTPDTRSPPGRRSAKSTDAQAPTPPCPLGQRCPGPRRRQQPTTRRSL